MTTTGADIIAKAASYIGKLEDGPDVPRMAREIGQAFPEFATYVTEATNAMPWCGDFVAYVLMQFGIRPPPVKDGIGFFYVDRWEDFGTVIPVGQEQPGDIAGFVYPPDLHHVTFVAGGGQYVGGNQHDAVTETHFSATPSFIRRAPSTGAPVQPQPAPVISDLRRCMGKQIIDFEARRDSAGHLAVYALPSGDGGGTYEVAGINDRYHPQEAARLKSLIEAGRYGEAEQAAEGVILSYTDVASTWCSDPGVEFYLRDSVFNRGPNGAAHIFQRALVGLGLDIGPSGEDGDVGTDTLKAARAAAPADLLAALRTARESYERSPVGRDESSKFWRGLVNRWNNALAFARRLEAEAPDKPIDPDPDVVPPSANPELDACLRDIIASVRPILEKHMAPVPATKPAPDLASILDLLGQLGIKPQPPAPPPPVTSKLDIGGTTGWKTITGLIGLVATVFGAPAVGIDTGGGLFAGLTAAFAALTSVGFVAKLDRGIKIAQQVSDALHKLSDQQQKTT